MNLRYGLLGSVLNTLERPDEGTEMFRRALAEARRLRPQHPAVDVGRYMLANQYLIDGDARDALEMADPTPGGVGHVQCLLHAVVAEAHWKVEQRDEARASARDAIAACPTGDRRTQLSEQLKYILVVG